MKDLDRTIRQDVSPRAQAVAAEVLKCHSNEMAMIPVKGGFSHNRRSLLGHDGKWLFVKEVDDTLLAGDGSRERSWLRKDFDCVEIIRDKAPEIVPDWEKLSQDGSVLLMTALRSEDGWRWEPPTESQDQSAYIASVLATIEQLNSIVFDENQTTRYGTTPYIRDLLAFDNGFAMLLSQDTSRHQLQHEYEVAAQSVEIPILRRAFVVMSQLLNDKDTLRHYAEIAKQLHLQPETCLSHGDVRVDNIAHHHVTRRTVLVDFDWLSLAPAKFDSTEFLIDVTRHGVDVSPWEAKLNKELLAAAIGYYARRAIEDDDGRVELRRMKLESAAIAALLLKRIL